MRNKRNAAPACDFDTYPNCLRVFRHPKLVAQRLEQPQQCQMGFVGSLGIHDLLAIAHLWITVDEAKVIEIQRNAAFAFQQLTQ